MIKSRFLTTKQRLEFMEVGFRSSFASGIVSALLTPIAIGVIEQYIPMFGDPSPTFFDKFSAFLLALGFSLGYAIFMAKASTCFIGRVYPGHGAESPGRHGLRGHRQGGCGLHRLPLSSISRSSQTRTWCGQ